MAWFPQRAKVRQTFRRRFGMSNVGSAIRSGRRGDVVVISGHRVGERERIGEILEALGEGEHVHYRVRWEDGSETVFYPGSDATIRRAQPASGRRTQ
jgi:hypothetical protein